MTTIETKIAKNGTRLYYVNGKRAGRNIALEAAADNREDNTFTVKYEYKWDAYYVAGAIQSSVVTYDEVVKKLVLSIDEYHGFSVRLDGVEIKSFCNKDQAKALVYQIEDAFIAGYAGIKIALDGSVNLLSREQIDLGILNDQYTLACQFVQAYVEQGLTQAQAEKLFVTAQADNLDYKAISDLAAQFKNETVEADINDYAVTTDAQDVATDAELNNAADDFKYVFFTFEKGKTYFCSNDIGGKAEVMTLTVIDRSDSMLTGKTADGTRKYKILEAIDSEAVKLHSSFDGDKIYARFEYSDAVKAVPTDNYSRFVSEVAAIFEAQQTVKTETELNADNQTAAVHIREQYENLKSIIENNHKVFGFTVQQTEQLFAAWHTIETKDECAKMSQMFHAFTIIGSNETDGSEDDSDNDNPFDLLPNLDELNDVDITADTNIQAKIDAAINEKKALARKIADDLNAHTEERLRAGFKPIIPHVCVEFCYSQYRKLHPAAKWTVCYDSINDTFGIWSEYGWHESGFSFGHEFCGWFNAEELAVVIEQLKTAIDYGRTEFEFVSKPNLPPRRSYAKYQTVRAANLKDKIARDAQSTNDNVFDLLPALDELNDVDETSAKPDKIPPVVYSNIIGGLSEKDAFHHFRVGDKSDGDVITFDGDRWCSIHCDTYDAIIRRHDSTEFFIIYRWNDPDGQYQSVEFSVPEDIFFTTMTDRGACSIDTPDLNELLIAELERDIADNNAFIDHLKREELATDYDLSQCRHAYRKKRDRTPDDAAEYKRLLLLKNKATALAVNVIPILRDAIDNLELTQDFYREAKPQDTLSAVADTCAQLNAHAPLGWKIHFDSEHNKFPVEFNGAPVVKLDSLATTKFLSPEDFFDQFRPLVDKNYSELQQFIRDRKDELHGLIQIRYEMADIYGDDSERLKTLDEMIAQVRRDIFHAEIAG